MQGVWFPPINLSSRNGVRDLPGFMRSLTPFRDDNYLVRAGPDFAGALDLIANVTRVRADALARVGTGG